MVRATIPIPAALASWVCSDHSMWWVRPRKIPSRALSEGALMASVATTSPAAENEQARHEPLIGGGMVVLFIALIGCFTAWGVAADLTTPMVAGFKRIFDMSTF